MARKKSGNCEVESQEIFSEIREISEQSQGILKLKVREFRLGSEKSQGIRKSPGTEQPVRGIPGWQ